MYLLDSNIIIDIFRGDTTLKKKLEDIQRVNLEVSTTTLNLSELYKGAYLSSQQETALNLINEFVKNVIILTPSQKSAILFGQDYAQLKLKGKIVPEIDLIIASIAKAHNATVITRNIKDFVAIPNLTIEQW